MKRGMICAMLAAWAISAVSGCGTLQSCTNEKRDEYLLAYGGLATDVRTIREGIARSQELAPGIRGAFVPLEIAVSACDLPLSAVADTVIIRPDPQPANA